MWFGNSSMVSVYNQYSYPHFVGSMRTKPESQIENLLIWVERQSIQKTNALNIINQLENVTVVEFANIIAKYESL